jgi:ABC-2 type transport system permease protein
MNRSTAATIMTLMRRELWESPISFKWTPLAIGALLLLAVIVTLIIGARIEAEMALTGDALRTLAQQPVEQRRLLVSGSLFSISAIFFQLMLLIIIFYLAGSLFDDRKDRSILYWKSLPVSDHITVASKLLTACLLVPALFLGAIILTQLALLLIATGYALLAGVNPLTTLWLPASLPKLWTVMALGLLVQALWLLPIYAWLLFCSSWAPRLPILIAIGVPAAISFMQHAWSLISSMSLPGMNIGLIILKRLGAGVLPMNIEIDIGDNMSDLEFDEELFMSFSSLGEHLLRPEMWIGIGLALLLLVASVWFRRRATDN